MRNSLFITHIPDIHTMYCIIITVPWVNKNMYNVLHHTTCVNKNHREPNNGFQSHKFYKWHKQTRLQPRLFFPIIDPPIHYFPVISSQLLLFIQNQSLLCNLTKIFILFFIFTSAISKILWPEISSSRPISLLWARSCAGGTWTGPAPVPWFPACET